MNFRLEFPERELHQIAARCMRNERDGHTLQTTALLNEAYLRLAGVQLNWEDRKHFFAMAARTMRRVLVHHAKAHGRNKRGSGAKPISLEDAIVAAPGKERGILLLDEALDRLAQQDRRKADLVELLYFGGLTAEEAADTMGISPATVNRDLRLAKAWLYNWMKQAEE